MRDDVREALAIDAGSSMRDRTVDITTIGRRTGGPRRIEIVFYRAGDDIYLSGIPAPKPRAWLLNLTANPQFTFHLKHGPVADLPATATIVTDPPNVARPSPCSSTSSTAATPQTAPGRSPSSTNGLNAARSRRSPSPTSDPPPTCSRLRDRGARPALFAEPGLSRAPRSHARTCSTAQGQRREPHQRAAADSQATEHRTVVDVSDSFAADCTKSMTR